MPGDELEVTVDGFVIDLVRGDLLIEVQTGAFSAMKRKLSTLLELGHRVRIVHPIPIDKQIVKVGDDGVVISRRLSPRHGHPSDLFAQLVSFPHLVAHPLLEIELALTREEEYRRHTLDRAWRRKGWTTEERRLVEVIGTVLITGVDDLAEMLPAALPEPFTTSDLAAGLGRPRRLAQQMAYCLRVVGVLVPVAKTGNAIRYLAA